MQQLHYDLGLSLSLLQQSGTAGNPNSWCSAEFRGNFRYDTVRKSVQTITRLRTELGFQYLGNKEYQKSTDLLELNWERNNLQLPALIQTSSIHFLTQFLSDYSKDPLQPEANPIWTSGFCNPFLLDVGIGWTKHFWTNCHFHLLYANLHTQLNPVAEPSSKLPDGISVNGSLLRCNYSFRTEWFIQRQLLHKLHWENTCVLNFASIHPSGYTIEWNNRLLLPVLNCLFISFDANLRSNPAPPFELQYRLELRLALGFMRI